MSHLKDLKNKEIFVLGLAFKFNTDDVRESAAIDIIIRLKKKGARIRACDPLALLSAQKVLGSDVSYYSHPHDGVEGVDAIIVATEWPEYKNLDWAFMKSKARNPILIDGRNLLDPSIMRSHGFKYEGIGRR